MPDRVNIATQVDPESELYQDFEEYAESYKSRSEAVRAALRDGMADDAITREEFEAALREQRREAQIGSWESGALTSAFLLASVAIAVAVSTMLPFVPSFEGIATASILVATAGALVWAVSRGTVERLERRFSTPAGNDPAGRLLAEVSD